MSDLIPTSVLAPGTRDTTACSRLELDESKEGEGEEGDVLLLSVRLTDPRAEVKPGLLRFLSDILANYI